MELQNVWGGSVYNMGYKQYDKYALWTDSLGYSAGYYQSVLGNSGELYMTANDSVNFCGKFYFQAIDGAGHIDNITNGDFKLTK